MSEVQNHNEAVYDDLQLGDLVEFKRWCYSHWAVFIGNGKVVHVTGLNISSGIHLYSICNTSTKGQISKDNFWDVVGDYKVNKNNSKDKEWSAYRPQEIVDRALSKLGPIDFNLISGNCEHCRYDKEKSGQVDRFPITILAPLAKIPGISSLAGLCILSITSGGGKREEISISKRDQERKRK